MMDKLIEEVQECVEREYGRAGAKFGLTNHSDHESYAIMLEEFQEALEEVGDVNRQLSIFWGDTKCNAFNDKKLDICKKIENSALLAACEFIQVAAMAKKAAITLCNRAAAKEFKGEDGNTA